MHCMPGLVLAAFVLVGAARADEPLRLRPLDAPVKLMVIKDETIHRGEEQVLEKHEEVTVALAIAADGEDLKVTFSFQRVVVEDTRAGQTRKVDTDTPEGKRGREGQMIGKEIVARVSPRGELRGLISAGGQPLAEVPPGQREQVKEMFFDGMIANAGLALLVPFPEGAPTPGTTWSLEQGMAIPGIGRLTMNIENQVESVEAEKLTVVQKGSASAPGEGGGPGLQTMKLEAKLVVSRKDGMVLEGEMINEMVMSRDGQEIKLRSVYKRKRAD